ncbi:Ig-like domain-containing protein [Methanofollis tationis]|uniref:VWA domain-containing protein n=1 Tax=Methanofollis tationis TaxID=81417 RepID=A0A7K4HN04_9EURY|nr:VWA domain-containing protein [Methanofollis tationis]NVO66653.1 VWA domain-containing protein [Methanofollis tationis]
MATLRPGLFLLCLLLICTGAAAGEPYDITVSTGTDWLIANGADCAAVTATVTSGGAPVTGVGVTFSCDPAMGRLSRALAVTDGSGVARSTFTAATTSGAAEITASATYGGDNGPVTISASCVQQIDHDTPYRLASRTYTSEVSVGSVTPIVLSMQDRYKNPIDSRRTAETVRFTVGSPGGSAGIWDGAAYVDDCVLPVDEDGNVAAVLKTSSLVGENIVYVDLPAPVADTYFTIYGIGDGIPASISCTISPTGTPNPWVPADGVSKFSILYTLKDAAGNPAGNRSLSITALPGEDRTVTTNSDGQIMITYGPKDTTGTVTITATSDDDPSVTCSRTVQFTNTAPVEMLLSANPQTMPSLDANPASLSEIRAKVMDEKGNPVSGETVAFSIDAIDLEGNVCTDPVLIENTATTDGDGYAVVRFVPGAFALPGSDDYNQTATATCAVVAAWGEVTHSIPLAWKNYPFLSVTTSVDPETVEVNETVSVNITLRGDGWALQPDPIDVVLVIDRSGSMLKDYPDRMVSTMSAAKTFVGQMNPARDRIGIVSFGARGTADIYAYSYKYWAGNDTSYWRDSSPANDDAAYISAHYPGNGKWYADYATTDSPLSYDHAAVLSSIDNLVPYSGTPMRPALYKAVKELIGNATSDVRAIIVLSDGDWNTGGDPLAQASGYDYYSDLSAEDQNMAIYAQNNNVRIYSIAFAQDISTIGKSTLQTLASTTDGMYYEAPTADDLTAIYTEIAGELKTEAGVDTTVGLQFDNVLVNGLAVFNDPADPVLDYVYLPGESTVIGSWIDNETGRHEILPLATHDNTSEWAAGLSLAFNVGTVRLNQTWTARFTLTVLKEGNINIFGPGSLITFNGGASNLTLPDTFVTAVPDLNNTGLNSSVLSVDTLAREGSGEVTDFLPLIWNLNYTGEGTVTQRLYYSTDDKHTWTRFATLTAVAPGNITQRSSLDVRVLPAGYYWIRVRATAPDAPDAMDELMAPILVGSAETPKIKLE